MRDLEEDLGRGLVNIPAEVVTAAEAQGAPARSHDALVATDAVRTWMSDELTLARSHLDAAESRLTELATAHPPRDPRGVALLSMFTRSIRRWATARAPARYPFLPAHDSPQSAPGPGTSSTTPGVPG